LGRGVAYRQIVAEAALYGGNVAYGSKADLTPPKSDFRFAPESGLKSDIAPCPFGAMNGSRRVTRPPHAPRG